MMVDGPETAETPEERKERVMRRLAEIVQGPPPESGGSGVTAGGGWEEAVAGLGLGLSEEDTARFAGAVGDGPDPAEAQAMFNAMLESFSAWRKRTPPGPKASEEPGPAAPRPPDDPAGF